MPNRIPFTEPLVMSGLNDNSARSPALLDVHQKVLAMPELHVAKTSSHVKAEADYAQRLLLRSAQMTAQEKKEHARAAAALLEAQRAHNVARLNRCSAVYLRQAEFVFRFIGSESAPRPEMRLCRVVGRKFVPMEFGPTVPSAKLHDDALVSAAIWNAIGIAEQKQGSA